MNGDFVSLQPKGGIAVDLDLGTLARLILSGYGSWTIEKLMDHLDIRPFYMDL